MYPAQLTEPEPHTALPPKPAPLDPAAYADYLAAGMEEAVRKYCHPTGQHNTRDWIPLETMGDLYRQIPHWVRAVWEERLGDRVDEEFPGAVSRAGWRGGSSASDPWRGFYSLARGGAK